jgi:hypothetical protein
MNESKWQSFWLIAGTSTVVIVIFFWALANYNKRTLTADECLRLDTNLKTQICLDKLKPSPIPDTYATQEILSQVSLSETKRVGNNDIFWGILKNNSKLTITNIVLKANFSRDKNCKDIIDTQYIALDVVLFPGDIKTINTPFGKFGVTNAMSCVTIDSAVIN